MVTCKKCLSEKIVKNSIIRRKQRYVCRECGHIFTEGDQRTNDGVIAKKTMCTILYSLSKAFFNMLAHIFDTWQSLVYRWIVEAGAKVPASEEVSEIREMEFDEMWHFVGSKKKQVLGLQSC
jgi:transposase-like protein